MRRHIQVGQTPLAHVLCQKGLPLSLKAALLHPLSQCRGLWGKSLEDRLGQSPYIETVTHCLYGYCSLITTSCKLRSPFLPFLGKGQGFRLPTKRTANDEQAPHLQRPEKVVPVGLTGLRISRSLKRPRGSANNTRALQSCD